MPSLSVKIKKLYMKNLAEKNKVFKVTLPLKDGNILSINQAAIYTIVEVNKGRSCYISFKKSDNFYRPLGDYTYNELKKANAKITGHYRFGLQCVSLQGKGYTRLLINLMFYLLKIKAESLKRKDYIIADHDMAMVNDDPDKLISRYNIEKFIHEPIEKLMERNLLYYERYGFVYPTKYLFLYYLKKNRNMPVPKMAPKGENPHDLRYFPDSYSLNLKNKNIKDLEKIIDDY